MSYLSQAPDALLVIRSREGDLAAFEALVTRYALLMRSYAYRIIGSLPEAEDAVQETLITAWQTMDKLREPAKAKSWLMRIVSSKSIDAIRSRKDYVDLEEVGEPGTESSSPEDVAIASSRMEALAQALDKLPPLGRRCWVLREIGEQSYVDIAKQLGVPPSTVRGQIARARAFLDHELRDWT